MARTTRLRTVAPVVTVALLVGYLLLVVYVATTGDPVAATVADGALAAGVVAVGLLLFVRPTELPTGRRARTRAARARAARATPDGARVGLVDATAGVLVLAGFVRLLALLSGASAYRVGAELLLALGVGLVFAGWLRRRRERAAARGDAGRRRGRSGGRAT
jgi:hypothetical protein